MIDHYRRQSSRLPADSYDASRLWQIEMLGPPKCYVGDETWSGYVLFDFENSTSLLEKPFYGNATYVLAGDWRKMVRKTKAGWLSRVRIALRQASYVQLMGKQVS